jgi:hypothetical protein
VLWYSHGVSNGKFMTGGTAAAAFAAGEESARGLAVTLGFDSELTLHAKLSAAYCPGVVAPDGLRKLRGVEPRRTQQCLHSPRHSRTPFSLWRACPVHAIRALC